ncbi:hypothetical protein SUDANB15_06008 [Streptomyces sp. enrichment culture]
MQHTETQDLAFEILVEDEYEAAQHCLIPTCA